jgi:hypothetical protein
MSALSCASSTPNASCATENLSLCFSIHILSTHLLNKSCEQNPDFLAILHKGKNNNGALRVQASKCQNFDPFETFDFEFFSFLEGSGL